ncbi:MAG: SusC/RagA family TonB-linked outer membrane protein, partial [Sphingobacteriales bacterium]
LQFAFRRDGSLRFSEESGRWGNFPSVLAGWIVSNENFWQNSIKFVDYFKLKASWGKMGNDAVPPFQYLAAYAYGTGSVFGSNGTYYPGLYQSNAPNPMITWEVANVYNIGFESQLFSRRLTFNAEFFYQKRDNILIKRNASVPAFTGIELPDQNFGVVESRGFEAELGYSGQVNKDFSWSVNGNVAFTRNRIIQFDEPEAQVPWQSLTGHPIGSTLLYESAGVFRDQQELDNTPHVAGAIPGDIVIKDQNGDKIIDEKDRIVYGKTANPEVTFGLSVNLRYKGFALSALVNGAGTAWVQMLGSQQGSAGDYYQYHADGRWTPDNIDASKPRAYDGFTTYWRGKYPTDFEYQDQNYARLKNVQLSYSIPRSVFRLNMVRDIQVYVQGQNLFLIYSSKDRIWDPEFSGVRDNYPLMRVLSLGARISFQ